jgi:hypothetical protein
MDRNAVQEDVLLGELVVILYLLLTNVKELLAKVLQIVLLCALTIFAALLNPLILNALGIHAQLIQNVDLEDV